MLSLAVEFGDDELIRTIADEARAMGDAVKDVHSDAELDWNLARRAEMRSRNWVALEGYFSAAERYARLGHNPRAVTILRQVNHAAVRDRT